MLGFWSNNRIQIKSLLVHRIKSHGICMSFHMGRSNPPTLIAFKSQKKFHIIWKTWSSHSSIAEDSNISSTLCQHILIFHKTWFFLLGQAFDFMHCIQTAWHFEITISFSIKTQAFNAVIPCWLTVYYITIWQMTKVTPQKA